MAEIIRLPKKTSPRDEALGRLAEKLAAHLTISFMRRKILDVPVQAFVADMLANLTKDGFDYEPEVIDGLADDPETMQRIEAMFLRSLVESGYLVQTDT